MTRAAHPVLETDAGPLPRPGAPHMDNLIAVMVTNDNRFARMVEGKLPGIDRVAAYQGFDAAEFRARYAELDALWERQLSEASLQPVNAFEIPEGK